MIFFVKGVCRQCRDEHSSTWQTVVENKMIFDSQESSQNLSQEWAHQDKNKVNLEKILEV